jgi:hypothetical protein
LIDEVFLFGLPAPSEDLEAWRAVCRVISGKLVNGYVDLVDDYVLAVLSRANSATTGRWGVAGLERVRVQDVENVKCEGRGGPLAWVGKVSMTLEMSGAKGVLHTKVEEQLRGVTEPIEDELDDGELAVAR